MARNGLNAAGGQLSCPSQLVRVRLRSRSGCSAAKIWAMPPPLSFPTRSTWSILSASRNDSSISAFAVTDTSWPGAISVSPCARRSTAMQRRVVGQLRELMAPQMAVQQHPMDEERDRPRALFGVADASRGRLNAVPGRRCSVAVHRSPLPRRRREALRVLELARAVLAAHLNRLTADLHFDGVCIQLAVASRTGLLCHDTALRMNPRIPGAMSRPRCAGERCQNL